MSKREDPYQSIETERARRRAWWIIGGTIAAVLVIGVAVVLFGRGDNDPQAATTPSTTAAPSTTPKPTTSPSSGPSTSTDPNASACGLPPGDQAIPTAAPAATWELAGSMAFPSDPKIGPGTTTDGLHTCYAHNPTGALFAAVGALADGTHADRAALLQARAVPSAAVDAAIAAASTHEPGNGRVQVVGYAFTGASADVVSMDIAMTVTAGESMGAMFVIPVTYQWFEGDWRLVYQPDLESHTIPNLVGFTPWGGV